MRINAARRLDSNHMRQKRGIAADHLFGDTPGANDFLIVIDIMQKGIDRAHTLLDATR